MEEPQTKSTLVANCYYSDYDVFVGCRRAKDKRIDFGNPYHLTQYSREAAIELYKEYFSKRLAEDNVFREAVHALRGLRLGCFCKDSKEGGDHSLCHAWVIANYLNILEEGS